MYKYLYFSLSLLLVLGSACKPEEADIITRISASETNFTEVNTNTTITLTLTAEGTINNPVTVNYTWTENSALRGVDFEAVDGSIEFSPDQLSQTISFEIIGDTHLELLESLSLNMTADDEEFVVSLFIQDGDPIGDILSDEEGFYTPETYPSMTTVWADEFNDGQLNLEDWNFDIGDGCDQGICEWGNNELQLYTDAEENFRLENGRLVFTARNDAPNDFTSARINTKDKVSLTYGRIDIRAKMPKGQGIWPALWMLGDNRDEVGWPRCGEIDIMELIGHEAATTHGTVHYDNNGYATNTSSKTLTDGDLSDQFHVYSIIWEENIIHWYLDNVQFKTFAKIDNGYPFNAPFYFLFNIAVGGNWPGNPDATTVFPQTMEVDYVRVFQ